MDVDTVDTDNEARMMVFLPKMEMFYKLYLSNREWLAWWGWQRNEETDDKDGDDGG